MNASSTFRIGGEMEVHRLGFGAMRLTGPGIWGEPPDRDEAITVLRRAVELGVNFIDTADSYGPYVSEDLICQALHPYAAGLVVTTKAGEVRTGPDQWHPLGRPEYLRQQCEMSLRRLRMDRIDLFQLHRVDPQVPLTEQVGELGRLRDEGKIRCIGLSEVSWAQIEQANAVAPIASVENRYNLIDRGSEPLLSQCERLGLAFIPWDPIATGRLAAQGSPLLAIAGETHYKPGQLALAWLLRRSPVMLPIPGTSSVAHLEENVRAAEIQLSDALYEQLCTIFDVYAARAQAERPA